MDFYTIEAVFTWIMRQVVSIKNEKETASSMWACMTVSLHDCEPAWLCASVCLHDCELAWLCACMTVSLHDCEPAWLCACMTVSLHDCERCCFSRLGLILASKKYDFRFWLEKISIERTLQKYIKYLTVFQVSLFPGPLKFTSTCAAKTCTFSF